MQAIKEKSIVSAEETQYVNSKDEQIRVNFPQNSVAKGEQMDFKVHFVNIMKKTYARNIDLIYWLLNIWGHLFGSLLVHLVIIDKLVVVVAVRFFNTYDKLLTLNLCQPSLSKIVFFVICSNLKYDLTVVGI